MLGKDISKKRGSIVLMDALGTKNRWNTNNKQKVFDQWDQFLTLIYNAKKTINEDNSNTPNPTTFQMNVHSFSDTILLTFPNEPRVLDGDGNPLQSHDEMNLLFACKIVRLTFVLGLAANLPFRGCISFGDYYENTRTVSGDAMIEASKYFERYDWIGVSLSPLACDIMQSPKHRQFFPNYCIPRKGKDPEEIMTIDFLNFSNPFFDISTYSLVNSNPECEELIHNMNLEEYPKNILTKMYNENSDCCKIAIKYKNTLDFIKHLENSIHPDKK